MRLVHEVAEENKIKIFRYQVPFLDVSHPRKELGTYKKKG